MSDLTPTNLAELQAFTEDAWSSLVRYVDAMPEEARVVHADAAGWTVKDHVAHVMRWDQATLASMNEGVPYQQTLGIPDDEWTGEDFDPMNERIRQQRLDRSWDEVREERDRTFAGISAMIARLTPEELGTPGGYSGLGASVDPLIEVLANYQGEHYREHLGYIRAIVGA